MSTAKSPVSAGRQPTGLEEKKPQKPKVSFSYANFNDSTALHIMQVLVDLYCEQYGENPVKLELKRA